MKKILFCAVLMTSFFALETVAQVRASRGKAVRTVSYQLDGKSVLPEDIDAKTTGLVSFSYGRLGGQASLLNGALDGPFKYNTITGLANKKGSFSVKDENENWAEGQIVCSGVETFKFFTYGLQTNRMDDFYKCIDVQKASYETPFGELSLLGSIKYPSFTEDTNITFTPRLLSEQQVLKNGLSPQKLNFQFDEMGENLVLNFVTQKEDNFSLYFKFNTGFLQLLHMAKNEKANFKKEILDATLTQVLIPQLDGKEGVVFKGGFNLVTGFKQNSLLNLFDQSGQRLIEVKKLNDEIEFWAKYPVTLNTFLEGKIYLPNGLNAVKNALLSLLFTKGKETKIKDAFLAILLSGLEIKDFTLFDEKSQKIASLNIKLNEKLTRNDILSIKQEPYLLDQYVKGEVILQSPQKEPMRIEFNNMDTVTVNGQAGFGENQADFYGLITMFSKIYANQIEIYRTQMEPILKNIVYVNDVYQAYLEQKERDRVLKTAKQFALTNYDYCVKELEAERIDYMYECQGIPFDKISGLKPINGIDMTLTPATKMGAEHSFIYYDEKIKRDVVMLQLKFTDEALCQSIATSQNQTCENQSVTIGIQTELKTY